MILFSLSKKCWKINVSLEIHYFYILHSRQSVFVSDATLLYSHRQQLDIVYLNRRIFVVMLIYSLNRLNYKLRINIYTSPASPLPALLPKNPGFPPVFLKKKTKFKNLSKKNKKKKLTNFSLIEINIWFKFSLFSINSCNWLPFNRSL